VNNQRESGRERATSGGDTHFEDVDALSADHTQELIGFGEMSTVRLGRLVDGPLDLHRHTTTSLGLFDDLIGALSIRTVHKSDEKKKEEKEMYLHGLVIDLQGRSRHGLVSTLYIPFPKKPTFYRV